MADVVLVHGAWSGPWVWGPLADVLSGRAIRSRAVALPSVAAAAPTVDYRDDADAVRAVLDDGEGPVLLVGHSYGGLVISEAGHHPKVGRLLYLAALMPDQGEGIADLMLVSGTEEFGAGVTFEENGLLGYPDTELALATAYTDAPPAAAELVRVNAATSMSFGADPALVFGEPAWRDVPTTYVVCEQDRCVRPEKQREWAEQRATRSVSLPSNHSPQLSHTAEIADLVTALAGELDSGTGR